MFHNTEKYKRSILTNKNKHFFKKKLKTKLRLKYIINTLLP